MTTPSEFCTANQTYADTVAAGTGISAEALLSQWGVEVEWGNAINNQNNLANIRCSPTTFCQFATLEDFCAAAVALWHTTAYINTQYPNGFEPFRAAAAAAGLESALLVIGQSPWDSGHYTGNPPYNYVGGSLIAAAQEAGFIMTTSEVQGVVRAALIACLAGSRTVTDADVDNWVNGYYAQHGNNLGLTIEAIQQDPECVAAQAALAKAVAGGGGSVPAGTKVSGTFTGTTS